jgi:hypothetical protein
LRVPDSHAFSRNPASGGVSGSDALKSAAEFEPFQLGPAQREIRRIDFDDVRRLAIADKLTDNGENLRLCPQIFPS